MLKDNHKLNPPSRKSLMNWINNDAMLYIGTYVFTDMFAGRSCVPSTHELEGFFKGRFLIKKSIPLSSVGLLTHRGKWWKARGKNPPGSSQTKTSSSAPNCFVCMLIREKSLQYVPNPRRTLGPIWSRLLQCGKILRLSGFFFFFLFKLIVKAIISVSHVSGHFRQIRRIIMDL